MELRKKIIKVISKIQITFIIQISFKIDISLSDYLTKVEKGNFSFPEYFDKCPICGSAGCAVKIGFYYRYVFDHELKRKIEIPVQRYLCRRINKPDAVSHRTFSLLPWSCIPFAHYDIPSMISAQKSPNQNKQNREENWLSYCVENDVDIGYETFLGFFILFEAGLVKLSLHLKKTFNETREYLFHGNSVSISFDFYLSTQKFLFGIPSQERF